MSSVSRRKFMILSGEVGMAALLTALSSTGEALGQGLGKESSNAPKPPAFAPRPMAWPLGNVPRDRTLIFSFQAQPMNGVCSPYQDGYSHQTGNAILYEPCAFYEAHAEKVINWLAESYSPNIDATQWTITFRQGIQWSDGTPFTAEDVAFSMTLLKMNPSLRKSSTYSSELISAVALNNRTLLVTLNQTDWRFFSKSLTFRFDLGDDVAVMPKHIFNTVPADQLHTFNYFDLAKNWPVSTGPYGVAESTDQFTHFDLRPTWWAVESGFIADYPDVWRLRVVPFSNESQAVQDLVNNAVDETMDLRPSTVIYALNQCNHLTTWTGTQPPFGFTDWWPISVYFNCLKPPFDNPKVRWAIAYAINQQQILDVGWGGAGTITNHPFPDFPKLMAYVNTIPDLLATYNVLEHNLTKTNQLMTEAGFTKDGLGFWIDAQGHRPEADLYGAVPLFGDIAPVIALQLRTAGFDCHHVSPPDVWTALRDGRASLFLFGHGGSTIDPYDTFQLYRKNNIAPIGSESGGNMARWSNDTFELVADLMNITNPDNTTTMNNLFRAGMEIWLRELPDCPIVQWTHRIPVNTFYWKNWPDQNNPYMSSALWSLTMLQVVLGLKARLTEKIYLPFVKR